MRSLALGLGLAWLVACAAPATPTGVESYPCVLHPPSELTPDLLVEQHVTARQGGHEGSFDAVLQKRGDELVVVGLGPMGVRAFVVRQRGGEVSFEQRLGPSLPFPPRNIVVDVHRAFFKRLPGGGDGEIHGRVDDEDVTETWREGSLVERRFARSDRSGVVRVELGPGCTRARCEPSTVRVVNEWFGYQLDIENRRFTWL